jgi:integrase
VKKTFRKSIRIDGKLISKEFTRAEDAKAWYSQLHSKKIMGEFDLAARPSRDGILFKEYAEGEFMANRRKNYPASTWRADEQRLRDHILPVLGNIPLAKVRGDRLRKFLAALVDKKGLNTKTRDRVQALVSVIYTEALNREEGSLVQNNPTFGLTFRRGKRVGTKAPSFLHTQGECVKYLRAAQDLSLNHYLVGCLGIMAGLRKQEMIAVRVRHVDLGSHTLEVSEKYIQASHEIVHGTKAGEESERYVPMSAALESALKLACKGASAHDFLLRDGNGKHLSPRSVFTLNEQTCKRAGLSVTVHGLRHTFGREFAQRSGNMGALQDILGHSNSATTRLYSSLGKDRLSKFKDVMDFDV